MATNLKPDSKREEFKKYLEKAGVMDSLTRVLVSLYEEQDRPQNAIDYFLDRLAVGAPIKMEMESLNVEVTELKKKISQLEEENKSLRDRLEAFEPSAATAGGEEAPSGSEAVAEE